MGWRKIWWAERHMRLLRRLRDEAFVEYRM
jgi:hypothetical protein